MAFQATAAITASLLGFEFSSALILVPVSLHTAEVCEDGKTGIAGLRGSASGESEGARAEAVDAVAPRLIELDDATVVLGSPPMRS